jgi:hypothetical protein
MTVDCGSLEFAWARLCARHGQRVDDASWRRIEHARAFAPTLELARATALAPWLVSITAESSPAQIEAGLRGHWRAHVTEIAGWLPRPWQAAVAWCAWLPALPALQHVARGGVAPAWLGEEWPAGAGAGLHTNAAAVDLLRQAKPAPTVGSIWVEHWRALLPAHERARAGALAQLVLTLQAHGAVFASAPAGQGWPQRAALRVRLLRLYRNATLAPAAIFIHLALAALDVERLRAELLRRAWFEPKVA